MGRKGAKERQGQIETRENRKIPEGKGQGPGSCADVSSDPALAQSNPDLVSGLQSRDLTCASENQREGVHAHEDRAGPGSGGVSCRDTQRNSASRRCPHETAPLGFLDRSLFRALSQFCEITRPFPKHPLVKCARPQI